MSNCAACEAMRQYAQNFLINGITESECESLRSNTGLNPDLSVLHTNCEDLNDMNDCLIGAQGDSLAAFDLCDLKEFLNGFMKNLHSVLHAMICSDCGQWDNIGLLSDALAKILQKLKEIGVWVQNGDTIFEGDFAAGKGIAGGNINLFGGTPDGSSWIRTNPGSTENDLAGGINT